MDEPEQDETVRFLQMMKDGEALRREAQELRARFREQLRLLNKAREARDHLHSRLVDEECDCGICLAIRPWRTDRTGSDDSVS